MKNTPHIPVVLVALLATCLPITHCRPAGDAGPLGIKVQFLGGEGGALPAGVTSLRITVGAYATTAPDCTPANPETVVETFQVSDLTDLDENDRREAVLSDMPYGCPLYATVEAFSDAALSYSSRADGIVIEQRGDRRFIEMVLTTVGAVSLLDATLEEPAFGLTATALGETDGRVLVAGGFTSAESTTCPDEYTDADCLLLGATDQAHLFDQASAQVHPMATRMRHPRALHSATLLGDGRVLIAGGVSSAILVLQQGSDTWAGWEIVDVVPQPAALQSIDIFDPALASGFDTSASAMMRYGKFAHAATLLLSPEHASAHQRRVLLVGGMGADAAGNIDVFSLEADDFLTASLQATMAPRLAPASVMLDEYIWVFGGTSFPGDETTPNVAVAERWDPTDDGNEWNVGTVSFDDFSTDHPEFVRLFPTAVELGITGSVMLVQGWYGARCTDAGGLASPTYDYTTSDTSICPPPGGSFDQTRDLIVDASTSTPTISPADATSPPHALAAVLRLEDDSHRGQVLVAGGITDVDFTTTDVMVVYTGQTTPTSQLNPDFITSPTFNERRALAAAAEMNGGSVVLAGGVRFDMSGTPALTIRDSLELLNWAE